MRTLHHGVVLLLLLLLALTAPVASASAQLAIPPMLGPWQGDARIVVDWTRRRTLPVRIVIHADDRVTGTVGEATLVGARFIRNGDGVARTQRWSTRYVIDAGLTGPVIRSENVWRTSLQILLDWHDEHFEGGLETSGWKVGSTERKTLAATIVLARPLAQYICELDPLTLVP